LDLLFIDRGWVVVEPGTSAWRGHREALPRADQVGIGTDDPAVSVVQAVDERSHLVGRRGGVEPLLRNPPQAVARPYDQPR